MARRSRTVYAHSRAGPRCDGSIDPSKIPYGGFSPVRLQEDALLQGPSERPRLTLHSPRPGFSTFLRQADTAIKQGRLEPATASTIPSVLPPSRDRTFPRVLCSARVMLSTGLIATTTRSASLSISYPLRALRAYRIGLYLGETFPALVHVSLWTCHHPYTGESVGPTPPV